MHVAHWCPFELQHFINHEDGTAKRTSLHLAEWKLPQMQISIKSFYAMQPAATVTAKMPWRALEMSC